MKFKDRYPNAQYLDEVRMNIIKSDTEEPCFICGIPTYFHEINYQAPFCSEECIDKMRGDKMRGGKYHGNV